MTRKIYKFAPHLNKIEEAPIILNGAIVGWHSVFIDSSGSAISGGCSPSKAVARRISTSEIIERSAFQFCMDNFEREFLLDEFPTTCGFAAGFDSHSTMFRAIAEAVERWIWSKWIDSGFKIEKANPLQIRKSPIAEAFLSTFEKVEYFKATVGIFLNGNLLKLQFGAVLGFINGGIYPGSRVCTEFEDPWEHGLVEAWRHSIIANQSFSNNAKNALYVSRVKFFSKNALCAVQQLDKGISSGPLPIPSLRLLRKVENFTNAAYVWRALCNDFIGWHLGDEKRFVY